MPGSRLTEHDRQRIALWLAEGLGYAEIARRLGRPTSTISREVGRNGQPGRYDASYAHQVTMRHARRSKSTYHESPAINDGYGRDQKAVHEFVEQFAMLMAQTGVPRMPARVLTCLLVTDSGARTAAELVQYLQVSPASISKAIGYLEGLDLMRRARDSQGRRERYIIDDHVWLRSWKTSAQAQMMWANAARQGVERLGAATPAGVRLNAMSQFFTQLADDMVGGTAAVAHDDALTVLAALVHASMPLTVGQLAAALDWPSERVSSALHDVKQHPNITDPIVLQYVTSGAYTIAANPDRLNDTQREALIYPDERMTQDGGD